MALTQLVTAIGKKLAGALTFRASKKYEQNQPTFVATLINIPLADNDDAFNYASGYRYYVVGWPHYIDGLASCFVGGYCSV